MASARQAELTPGVSQEERSVLESGVYRMQATGLNLCSHQGVSWVSISRGPPPTRTLDVDAQRTVNVPEDHSRSLFPPRKQLPTAEGSACVEISLPPKQYLIWEMVVHAKFPPQLLDSLYHRGAAAGWCQTGSQFHVKQQISADTVGAWQHAGPRGELDLVSSLQNLSKDMI